MEDQDKTHWEKYKWWYISTGALLLAGITLVVVRSHQGTAGNVRIIGRSTAGNVRIIGRSSSVHIGDNVYNLSATTGVEYGGFMTRCVETGEVFSSQIRAAIAYDISPTSLSNHLNGRTPHVNGYTFERIMLAD